MCDSSRSSASLTARKAVFVVEKRVDQGLHQGRVGPRPSFFRIKPENTGRVGAAEKDKPEKTGRVGAATKDKPEKTGRGGSAEIGGKTGSGRVLVGLTRFFPPFFLPLTVATSGVASTLLFAILPVAARPTKLRIYIVSTMINYVGGGRVEAATGICDILRCFV